MVSHLGKAFLNVTEVLLARLVEPPDMTPQDVPVKKKCNRSAAHAGRFFVSVMSEVTEWKMRSNQR